MSLNDTHFTWPGFDAGDPAQRTLHGWLVLDVQHQASIAAELLDTAQAMMNGAAAGVGGTGNGYEFDFEPDGLRLEGLYPGEDTAAVTLPYPLVVTALQAWLKHIDSVA